MTVFRLNEIVSLKLPTGTSMENNGVALRIRVNANASRTAAVRTLIRVDSGRCLGSVIGGIVPQKRAEAVSSHLSRSTPRGQLLQDY
jgi:hypothetical protein